MVGTQIVEIKIIRSRDINTELPNALPVEFRKFRSSWRYTYELLDAYFDCIAESNRDVYFISCPGWLSITLGKIHIEIQYISNKIHHRIRVGPSLAPEF